MISLELKSRKIQDILKYIYLCLGKDEVPLQELVFFIAYDLNLYAPSSCEKVITAGINAGLVSVSKAKIVTFHVDKLASGTGDHAEELPEPTSPVVLAGKLAASEKILDKAVSIKDGRIIEARSLQRLRVQPVRDEPGGVTCNALDHAHPERCGAGLALVGIRNKEPDFVGSPAHGFTGWRGSLRAPVGSSS